LFVVFDGQRFRGVKVYGPTENLRRKERQLLDGIDLERILGAKDVPVTFRFQGSL
jgi:hypothetical protein